MRVALGHGNRSETQAAGRTRGEEPSREKWGTKRWEKLRRGAEGKPESEQTSGGSEKGVARKREVPPGQNCLVLKKVIGPPGWLRRSSAPGGRAQPCLQPYLWPNAQGRRLRQASEQYFTSVHTLAHFFRQRNGRRHAAQVFTGRSDFFRILGIAYFRRRGVALRASLVWPPADGGAPPWARMAAARAWMAASSGAPMRARFFTWSAMRWLAASRGECR